MNVRFGPGRMRRLSAQPICIHQELRNAIRSGFAKALTQCAQIAVAIDENLAMLMPSSNLAHGDRFAPRACIASR